jgi:hypothetical protein
LASPECAEADRISAGSAQMHPPQQITDVHDAPDEIGEISSSMLPDVEIEGVSGENEDSSTQVQEIAPPKKKMRERIQRGTKNPLKKRVNPSVTHHKSV